eukprot:1154607-Pelagomonas_calceolata.AAC.7
MVAFPTIVAGSYERFLFGFQAPSGATSVEEKQADGSKVGAWLHLHFCTLDIHHIILNFVGARFHGHSFVCTCVCQHPHMARPFIKLASYQLL